MQLPAQNVLMFYQLLSFLIINEKESEYMKNSGTNDSEALIELF